MKQCRLLLLSLTLVFVGAAGVRPALAWNNKDTHPAINDWAVKIFEKDLRPADKLLASTRLDGAECLGVAWDPEDGTANTTQSIAVNRKKPLKKWIVDGGFSADEPEILMGLRHFYDPKNPSTPWLTDTHGVADWLESHVTPERRIPEIDAVTWAIDTDDRGDDGAYGVQEWISISQDYSWYDAKKYFKLALADESRDNLNYGKAWRAVGEVMHLMADMAVPAHVRNDGHMWSEPLESNTDRSRVNACAGLSPASTVNYNTGIETLMRALATWTNENFLSQDTVPLPGNANTANGQPAYASPIPTKTTGLFEAYTVSGQTLIMARLGQAGLLGRLWGNNAKQLYQVDDKIVLESQQSILIPTAIRACAAVLNRFLPRFSITAEVSQSPDMAGTSFYSIHGEVKQIFSGSDWNENLTIKNGVYLVINGKAEAIPKRIAGGDFNEFSHDFSAQENDEVFLRYDLGGYVVESAKVKIAATTQADVQFTQTWEKSHWPSGWHPELATITFTVVGTGSVDFAQKPLVEVKDFNVDDAKIIRVSNMKRSENFKISGSLLPTLSATNISPYTPTSMTKYIYSNPQLVRCSEYYSDEQIVERYAGFNFSWSVPANTGTYIQTQIYLVYDVYSEEYSRKDEDSSFSLVSSQTVKSPVFHLQIELDRSVPEWDDL